MWLRFFQGAFLKSAPPSRKGTTSLHVIAVSCLADFEIHSGILAKSALMQEESEKQIYSSNCIPIHFVGESERRNEDQRMVPRNQTAQW
jgi:hypothetical protein